METTKQCYISQYKCFSNRKSELKLTELKFTEIGNMQFLIRHKYSQE